MYVMLVPLRISDVLATAGGAPAFWAAREVNESTGEAAMNGGGNVRRDRCFAAVQCYLADMFFVHKHEMPP